MVNSVCFVSKNTFASAAKAAGVSLREGDLLTTIETTCAQINIPWAP